MTAESRQTGGLRKFAIWLIASGLLLLVLSTGAGRLLEGSDSALSLSLYPVNAEAEVRGAVYTLEREAGEQDLVALQAQLKGMTRYNRIDARLFSLLGEVSRRMGDPEGGEPYFDHAYALSRTDLLTLSRLLERSIELEEPVEAANYLDVLLRRWPDRFDQVADMIPALLSYSEGYAAILQRLGNEPPWRGRLIQSLSRNAETVPIAAQVVLDLTQTGAPTTSEVSSVINGYIAQGRYTEAYQMFTFTLDEAGQNLEGYVFNDSFAPVATGRPFDWQYRQQPGVEISLPSSAHSKTEDGVVVRFLNKPVKTITLQQYLHLPPGSYTLSLDASASSLKLPKDLYWTLSCVRPASALARMAVAEGTYSTKTLQESFTIEPGTCPLQMLRLESGLIAESWRYRYSGKLTMHRLHIERTQP